MNNLELSYNIKRIVNSIVNDYDNCNYVITSINGFCFYFRPKNDINDYKHSITIEIARGPKDCEILAFNLDKYLKNNIAGDYNFSENTEDGPFCIYVTIGGRTYAYEPTLNEFGKYVEGLQRIAIQYQDETVMSIVSIIELPTDIKTIDDINV